MERTRQATTVYFIRHGENPANITREFSCRRVDYPLTPKGIEQARQTAEHFRGQAIAAVYASPLRRAAQTANSIGDVLGLPVLISEPFREINVGRLEDELPTEENWALHDRIFADWLSGEAEASFPGGESYTELLARMREGLSEVITAHPGRQVVIVGHGGILTATLPRFCRDVRLEDLTAMPNCAITEMAFEWHAGTLDGALRAWATCAHLA
ncbi:MAG: histidine phosphatase family protein [Ktedonobacterales bacterium]|nr:histidine phosphatase family protein [Ktedonobacterales bacterium]